VKLLKIEERYILSESPTVIFTEDDQFWYAFCRAVASTIPLTVLVHKEPFM
jgi:hypothetical protein